MVRHIYKELKKHIPFTLLGALSGIGLMMLLRFVPSGFHYRMFYLFHPIHVFLSAFVTSSVYRIYTQDKRRKRKAGKKLLMLIFVGYVGSIGIATLSDSIIPYLGEVLLSMPHRTPHIGFIDKWWLINPLAFAGVAIAFFKPATKFPHSGHVLLSTWASLFHIMMAVGESISLFSYFIIFFFLFIAVWLPCCISDIVFPLLFIKNGGKVHGPHH
ncbi:MAG: hypothetical protein ACQESB_05970 [Elusimicrobiota bacterium]